MILPDVNVLIYAFRPGVPEHTICRPWLDDVILGEARFGISPLALGGLVRITADARLRMPSEIGEALGFCQDLPSQPHCQMVEPGERHWQIFQRLCVETNTRGR